MENEYTLIKSLSDGDLVIGAEWCIIDKNWWMIWADAMKDHKPGTENPKVPPINNSELLEPDVPEKILKQGLDQLRFKTVPRKAWDILQKAYGGEDRISRTVVQRGEGSSIENRTIDLWPHFAKVGMIEDGSPQTEKAKVESLSKYGTLLDFIVRKHKELGLPVPEGEEATMMVRLWRKVIKAKPEGPEAEGGMQITTMFEEKATFEWLDDGSDDTKMDIDEPEEKEAESDEEKGDAMADWELVEDDTLTMSLDAMSESVAKSLLIDTQFCLERANEDGTWNVEWTPKWRRFEKGGHLDVKDSNDQWYSCRIEATQGEHIYITYIGCDSKYDEWVKKDDLERTAKHHTYTPHVAESSWGAGAWSWSRPGTKGKPLAKGSCGLVNLGNTCYMNSTIQCLAQTSQLKDFFFKDEYKKEVNEDNPLGHKGVVAQGWGGVIKKIWGEEWKTVSPTDFKKTIGNVAPRFSGTRQHDSQEFMQFLLDGLHEDMNRIKDKKYVEAVESKGRPDREVAKEAWGRYLQRNDSIVVDTFTGQLKSKVVCPGCKQVSCTFDPFNVLSIPLPAKTTTTMRVIVRYLDPNRDPTIYGLELPKNGTYQDLKTVVNDKCGIKFSNMIVVQVASGMIQNIVSSAEYNMSDQNIWVYETPPDAEIARWFPGGESGEKAEYVPCQIIPKRHSGDRPGAHFFTAPLVMHLPTGKVPGKQVRTMLEMAIRPFLKDLPPELQAPETAPEKKPEPEGAAANAGEDEGKKTSTEAGAQAASAAASDDKPAAPAGGVVGESAVAVDKTPDPPEPAEPSAEPSPGDQTKREDPPQDVEMEPMGGDKKEEATGPSPPVIPPRLPFLQIFTKTLTGEEKKFDDDAMMEIDAEPDKRVNFYLKWDENDEKDDNIQYFNVAKFKTKDSDPSTKLLEEEAKPESKEKEEITLEDCLDLFVKKETLSELDAWYCATCKKHQRAEKQMQIWSLPPVLIVHLKRFQQTATRTDKIEERIVYPTKDFILNKWLAGEEDINKQYSLFGVVNHSGNLSGGHYVADALNEVDTKWYHFNDEHVTSSDEKDVVKKTAYVLFYKCSGMKIDGLDEDF